MTQIRSQADAWQIAWDHRHVAHGVLRGASMDSADRDDFLQSALLVLFHLAQLETAERPFAAMAWIYLRWHLYRWLEKKKRDARLDSRQRDMGAESPDFLILERLRQLLAMLPERTRKIMLAVSSGETIADAGKPFGISRQRAHAIYAAALDALRKKLLGENEKRSAIRVGGVYECYVDSRVASVLVTDEVRFSDLSGAWKTEWKCLNLSRGGHRPFFIRNTKRFRRFLGMKGEPCTPPPRTPTSPPPSNRSSRPTARTA